MNGDAVKEITALAESRAKPALFQAGEDRDLYILSPDGTCKLATEIEKKKHIRTTLELHRLKDFLNAVNLHKQPHSVVFAGQDGAFSAVIDYDRDGERGRCEHIIRYTAPVETASAQWIANNGKVLSQTEFCEFLEEWGYCVKTPESAEIAEICMTLRVTTESVVTAIRPLGNGAVSVGYQSQDKAVAGASGAMEFPDQIEISIPIYQGAAPEALKCRLNYLKREGAIQFRYTIIGLAAAMEKSLQAAAYAIEEETDLSVWRGGYSFHRQQPEIKRIAT